MCASQTCTLVPRLTGRVSPCPFIMGASSTGSQSESPRSWGVDGGEGVSSAGVDRVGLSEEVTWDWGLKEVRGQPDRPEQGLGGGHCSHPVRQELGEGGRAGGGHPSGSLRAGGAGGPAGVMGCGEFQQGGSQDPISGLTCALVLRV